MHKNIYKTTQEYMHMYLNTRIIRCISTPDFLKSIIIDEQKKQQKCKDNK